MNVFKQPDVPLYLDTTVLWRASVIAKLRAAFPQRAICVPSMAHFERVHQLRLKWGADFDASEIHSFLDTYGLTLIPFDHHAADQMAEMVDRVELKALTEISGENSLSPEERRIAIVQHGKELQGRQANWLPVWPEKKTDVIKRPCGQRCRVSDYVIAATAKARGGILLSDDKAILDASAEYPDLFPQTVGSEQVGKMLGQLFQME
jgi:hypothetical protein